MATATKKKIAAPRLGEFGTYISTKGHQKLAQVVGTPESTNGSVNEGFVNIVVTRFDGSKTYGRVGVPLETVAADIPDYTVEGELRGFFRAN